MTTRVVHCKREPYDVYIGRPSKWGNPYAIDENNTREEVIDKYRLYMLDLEARGLRDLSELKGKVLGCWCAPKACHGDVLARLADARA